jgi:hypothetical protein
VITCSNKKCVDVSLLQSFIGMTFAHLVRYSIAMIMYLDPILFDGGLIGPTKSISHLSNSCNDTVVAMASRPFCWVFLPFEKHHIFDSTPSSLCE